MHGLNTPNNILPVLGLKKYNKHIDILSNLIINVVTILLSLSVFSSSHIMYNMYELFYDIKIMKTQLVYGFIICIDYFRNTDFYDWTIVIFY